MNEVPYLHRLLNIDYGFYFFDRFNAPNFWHIIWFDGEWYQFVLFDSIGFKKKGKILICGRQTDLPTFVKNNQK